MLASSLILYFWMAGLVRRSVWEIDGWNWVEILDRIEEWDGVMDLTEYDMIQYCTARGWVTPLPSCVVHEWGRDDGILWSRVMADDGVDG